MSSVQELRAALRPSVAQGKPAEAPIAADKAATQAPSSAIGMLVLAAAVGLCVGIALDRFVLPHGAVAPTPAAITAAPRAPAVAAGDLLATGTFIQPDVNNPLNRGSGGVSVHNGEVVLGADFTVTPGPDYRVLLVPKPAIRASADVTNTMYVDLGPLAAFKGGQTYQVPAGVDLSDYPSVVIWCATYGTLISAADLSFGK